MVPTHRIIGGVMPTSKKRVTRRNQRTGGAVASVAVQKRVSAMMARLGAIAYEQAGAVPDGLPENHRFPVNGQQLSLLDLAQAGCRAVPADTVIGQTSKGQPLHARRGGRADGELMGYTFLNSAVKAHAELGKVRTKGGVDKVYRKGHPPSDADWSELDAARAEAASAVLDG